MSAFVGPFEIPSQPSQKRPDRGAVAANGGSTAFAGRERALDDPVDRTDGSPGELDMGEVHQLVASEAFSLQAAGRLVTKIFAPWVQDLALLVESVEAVRPA